jgi:predicted histone-like DNA-binding protein
MTVKYNIVERGNPSNPQAPKKRYPSIESSGRRTLRQMAERISQVSTISTADTMAVLEAMLTIIPQELADGNIVELGDFGNFWLRSESIGVDVTEEVRPSQIKVILPRFNPGKQFKKILATIKYEKI